MKVGGGLGSKGTLSSDLSMRAISGVLGYPSLEKKFEILILKDAITGYLTGSQVAQMLNAINM